MPSVTIPKCERWLAGYVPRRGRRRPEPARERARRAAAGEVIRRRQDQEPDLRVRQADPTRSRPPQARASSSTIAGSPSPSARTWSREHHRGHGQRRPGRHDRRPDRRRLGHVHDRRAQRDGTWSASTRSGTATRSSSRRPACGSYAPTTGATRSGGSTSGASTTSGCTHAAGSWAAPPSSTTCASWSRRACSPTRASGSHRPSRPTSGHPPSRRNGLARVVRRGARLKEVSLVDQAGVVGSSVESITAPGTGPSTATAAALAEAEDAARGTGVAARQRIDQQAEAALAWAEADALVAAANAGRSSTRPTRRASTRAGVARADGRTWQQRLDDENERLWHLAREDDARREYFEALARRQRAELYAERHAAELDAVLRAHGSAERRA